MKESENLFNFVTRGVCSSDRYARYKLAEEKIDGVNVLLIGGEGETVELVEGINYIIPEGKVSYEIRAIDREIVEHLTNFVETKPTGAYDKRIIVPDPEKSSHMIQAFTLYSTGTINGQALCDKLYEQGLRSKKGGKLQDSMLFVYLKNPIYIGKIAYKGEIFEGHHEALIDEDTFNHCQEVMAEHNQNASRRRVHNYLLRGYVFCADCNRRLWAEKHKKPNGLIFDFYYCKTHRKGSYVAVDELEKQVEKGFQKVEVTKEYASQLESLAITILKEFRDNSDSDSKALTNRKSSLEAAIREAEDNWLIQKKLSFEQYSAIEKRYNTEIAGLDEKLNEGKKDYQKALKTIQGLMGLAQNIGQTYKDADDQLKRYYLSLFFDGGGFFVKDGKIVKTKLSKDVKALIKEGSVRVRMNWLRLWDIIRMTSELETSQKSAKQNFATC